MNTDNYINNSKNDNEIENTPISIPFSDDFIQDDLGIILEDNSDYFNYF